MAPQVPELVAQDPAPDEGLHPHVASAHAQVVASPGVGAPVLLDEYGSSAHLQEPSPKRDEKKNLNDLTFEALKCAV